MSESRPEKRKVEFIESYWTGGELGANYQWSDNHGELIRCKDCKWSKPEKVFKNVPTSKDMVRWCKLITRYVDDDWFCADGERGE